MRLSFPHSHYWYEVGVLKVPVYVRIVVTHIIVEYGQPGMLASVACSQLNRENEYSHVPVLIRDVGLTRRVQPSRPASACSFSVLRLNLVFINKISLAFCDNVHLCIIPPTAIMSVPSLSGHTNVYRSRSLPRVNRRRVISPQGSSSNSCYLFRFFKWPSCGAPLVFHTHY